MLINIAAKIITTLRKITMSTKNFIAKAIKHPGALRKELHAKKGQNIPEEKLDKAAKLPGKEGKRAILAKTLKSMHKK